MMRGVVKFVVILCVLTFNAESSPLKGGGDKRAFLEAVFREVATLPKAQGYVPYVDHEDATLTIVRTFF
jgi:hypothetical protein